jgi:hypothetical protein
VLHLMTEPAIGIEGRTSGSSGRCVGGMALATWCGWRATAPPPPHRRSATPFGRCALGDKTLTAGREAGFVTQV